MSIKSNRYDLQSMEAPHSCSDIENLNALLRAELTAVETYNRAIRKFDRQKIAHDLTRLRDEHRDASQAIEEQIRYYDGQPECTSGLLGKFAAAVSSTAHILGSGTMLAALKKVEAYGVWSYEDALGNSAMNEECKFLIRTQLLPACKNHIRKIERLKESQRR